MNASSSAFVGEIVDADEGERLTGALLRNHASSSEALRELKARMGRSRISLRQIWEISDISAHDLANEVAAHYGLPRASLPQLLSAQALVGRFAHRFLREASIFPFEEDGSFHLAMADPGDQTALRAAEIELGGPVKIAVVSFEDISTALDERLGDDDRRSQTTPAAGVSVADESVDSLRDLASGAPVVRAVDDLIETWTCAQAISTSNRCVTDSRCDARRRVASTSSFAAAGHAAGVDLAHKDPGGPQIAERWLPQDGAARMRVARLDIDIRVATMPTQHGEAAVIRLLPRDRGLLEISKLGLSIGDEGKLRRALDLPHGMVVITGPTGSGKTTTLATMLSALNTPFRKILTIEDPIEYEIPGINQSQVKPAIGLTFAAAMRAFVRLDPDVIMIGEVRDIETANIAIHAALTGHLVLTTLHTETAVAAVPRLIDLGVEGFMLKSTLRSVFAQRLVRLLCDRCKIQRQLAIADLAADPRYQLCGLGAGDTLWEPKGCGGVGYRGRIGIFEALEITTEVRDLLGRGAESHLLDEAAMRSGMTPMMMDAVSKCRAGVTSISEVLRVVMVR
jgi:general secretion pathway protein E